MIPQEETSSVKFICEKLTEWFDAPCNYTLDGMDITDIDPTGEWCEIHGCQNCAECWEWLFRRVQNERMDIGKR